MADSGGGVPAHEAAEELYKRARAAQEEGDLERAITLYQHALTAHAKPAHVFNDLAVALLASGKPGAARVACERALTLEPDADDTWFNLATCAWATGDEDAAFTAIKKAMELAPEEPQYLRSFAMALRDIGDHKAALAHFERLIETEPDDPENSFQLAYTLLIGEHYRRGFEHYESRLGLTRFDPRQHDQPYWDGSALGGRTLMVSAEQGLGDMMMFSRFLEPLLERADGSVIGEANAPLVRLFEASFPQIAWSAVGDEMPPHDLVAPLPSLPHLLSIDAADITRTRTYLGAAPTSRDAVPQLPETGRPRIGLTWSGNQTLVDRSCPFELFVALAEIGGVDFYSLQRGEPAQEIAAHGMATIITNLEPALTDFSDDAAVLEQLDLVITIDTAICHLAGALGIPCWTMLMDPADWRYPPGSDRTPWHPSMRLFRSPAKEGWRPIIAEVNKALREFAASGGHKG